MQFLGRVTEPLNVCLDRSETVRAGPIPPGSSRAELLLVLFAEALIELVQTFKDFAEELLGFRVPLLDGRENRSRRHWRRLLKSVRIVGISPIAVIVRDH
jgi:hypothetical protein